jgi:glutathione synthase/RimK-type ligase-like ATP-grasp enzyme
MSFRTIGVYREPEFSPGKIEADAAILNQVLMLLRDQGAHTEAMTAERFSRESLDDVALVIAMCQGAPALSRLASMNERGAITINSALAIRNCYRDLLGAGLMRAGIPIPDGALISTSLPLDLKKLRVLDLSAPIYVKRGDLHALGSEDVRRVEGVQQLEQALVSFARRGIGLAYVQQEIRGTLVKFYGVSDEFFSAIPSDGQPLDEALELTLQRAAQRAATALGLEVWGGDAIISADSCSIVDFNDWPSFAPVRAAAATAIARRCLRLVKRHPLARSAVFS